MRTLRDLARRYLRGDQLTQEEYETLLTLSPNTVKAVDAYLEGDAEWSRYKLTGCRWELSRKYR